MPHRVLTSLYLQVSTFYEKLCIFPLFDPIKKTLDDSGDDSHGNFVVCQIAAPHCEGLPRPSLAIRKDSGIIT